jgi:hypothetical protein
MAIIINIVISLVVSLTVSIVVKIAIGIKWIINVNEIILRCEKEKSIEYRILNNWWTNNQHNFTYNKKGKLIMNKDDKKKLKRYKRLSLLFEKGKLQQ